MSAIQRRDKLYKNSKHSGLKTDKDSFKAAKAALTEDNTKEKEILLWRKTG